MDRLGEKSKVFDQFIPGLITPHVGTGKPAGLITRSRQEAFNLGVLSAVNGEVSVDAQLGTKRLAAVYEVRSYDQKLHPDLFRGGRVLGVVIRVLNFLRWKLEVFVQYLTLQYMMDEQKFSPTARKEVLKNFKLDVIKEKVEFLESSPLRALSLPTIPSFDRAQDSAPLVTPQQEAEDFGPGRPIEEFIERHAPKSKRRLVRGAAPKDLFEALMPDEEEGNTP